MFLNRSVAPTVFAPGLSAGKAGFTLIETLVAITILTIAIVGPFQAIQTALTSSRTSRDTLIASSLAQEGIEYVRGVRDANFAYNSSNPSAPGSWLFGLDGTTRAAVGSSNCITSSCTIDLNPTYTTAAQIVAVCAGTCGRLYTTTSGRYTQQSSGNTATRFTRSFQLTTINVHETKITATTTWITNGISHSTVLVDYLQNWL